ncbi:unnamed protein product [Cylindrotheca closterium]|uniref:Uncharacterized protein n=1 Tax=Cylindrotheca closterium TaxID=2856 RepID=A0AAD2GCI4_9STRA|nr:unnamed protein product [Cylindrotheca closterium]
MKLVEEKAKSCRWRHEAPVHRQLIRDIKFRYGPKTKATEIHRDPERQYSNYSIQTIRTKVKEVRLLVQNLHCYDMWPDNTTAFLESCELDRLPDPTENFLRSSKATSSDAAALDLEVAELTNRLVKKDAENKEIKRARDQLQAEYNQIVNDRQSLQVACNQIAKVRDRLNTENKKIKFAKDKLQAEFHQTLIKIRNGIDQIAQDRDKLTTENKQIKSAMGNLEAEFQQTKNKKRNIEDAFNRITQDRDKLDTENKQIQSAIDKLQVEFQQTKAKKRNLKDAYNRIAYDRDRLYTENKRMKREQIELAQEMRGFVETTKQSMSHHNDTLWEQCEAIMKNELSFAQRIMHVD